jgi:hypothetical protein
VRGRGPVRAPLRGVPVARRGPRRRASSRVAGASAGSRPTRSSCRSRSPPPTSRSPTTTTAGPEPPASARRGAGSACSSTRR